MTNSVSEMLFHYIDFLQHCDVNTQPLLLIGKNLVSKPKNENEENQTCQIWGDCKTRISK